MNYLANGYRKHIRPFMVRIRLTKADGSPPRSVSGIITTRVELADGTPCCLVVTAAHVVMGLPDTTIHWELTRHAEEGCAPRLARLTSHGDQPKQSEIQSKQWGFILLNSALYDVAALYFALGDAPFVDPHEKTPTIVHPEATARPGTEVAWAGYPGIVERYLGRPVLCCYRGSIAATVVSTDFPVYIVDGHASPGVSGGPVWHSDKTGTRLIGIVSAYVGDDSWQGPVVPGLCHFAPLNLLEEMLASADHKLDMGGDSASVNP